MKRVKTKSTREVLIFNFAKYLLSVINFNLAFEHVPLSGLEQGVHKTHIYNITLNVYDNCQ